MQRRCHFKIDEGATVIGTVYFSFDVDATHRINVPNILPLKASASLDGCSGAVPFLNECHFVTRTSFFFVVA